MFDFKLMTYEVLVFTKPLHERYHPEYNKVFGVPYQSQIIVRVL